MARPTEIKAVAKLLEAGAESPEELAKFVINTIDDLRAERPYFTVVSIWGKAVYGCGPFATDNKGREALTKGRIPVASFADHNFVVKTYSPQHAEQSLERADA